jgi:hypothetical protein
MELKYQENYEQKESKEEAQRNKLKTQSVLTTYSVVFCLITSIAISIMSSKPMIS